jgi:hypothetical protein
LEVHYRRGGKFCCFAGFSEVVGLKISDQGDIWGDPKGKSISRGEKRRMEAEARRPPFSRASGSNNDGTKPSKECKAALFQALYEWFKKTPFTNLNRNYLALGDVIGKEAFRGRMWRLFEDAIYGEEWDEDKRKPGYSAWMEDKLVDALCNTQPVLDKYRKLQTVPMNNKELAAFKSKVEHFCGKMKNWSKKSQKSSATWQQGMATEMMLRGGHLIHFNDKVKVSYQGKKMEGGYGTIQKCFIENDPTIPKHWAFAAKTQKGDLITTQTVQFNAEAMALRSTHEGYIK